MEQHDTQKSLNRSLSYPLQGSQQLDGSSGSGVGTVVEKLNEDSEEEFNQNSQTVSPDQIDFEFLDTRKWLEDIRDPSFFSGEKDVAEDERKD